MSSININDIINGLLCKDNELITYAADYFSSQSVDECFVNSIRTNKSLHSALVKALSNKSERVVVAILAGLINCTSDNVFAIQFIRNTHVADILVKHMKSSVENIQQYAIYLMVNLCVVSESLNLSTDQLRFIMTKAPFDQNFASILICAAQHSDQALKIWSMIDKDFREKFTLDTEKNYYTLVKNIAFHGLEAVECVQFHILRDDLWAQTSADLFYHDSEREALPKHLTVAPVERDDIEGATLLLETIYLLCRKNRAMREVLRAMTFYPLVRETDRHYQTQELYELAEDISNFLCGDEEKVQTVEEDSLDE